MNEFYTDLNDYLFVVTRVKTMLLEKQISRQEFKAIDNLLAQKHNIPAESVFIEQQWVDTDLEGLYREE